MPDYRRFFVPGGTYFFTVVTAQRRPLFADESARTILGQVMREIRGEQPFETVAIVLLPDRLHAIWTLPTGDDAYPGRWQAIKARFTNRWLECGGDEVAVSKGYVPQRRRGVWQARYMEHVIRDEDDLSNHADYIHYNSVKHMLVRSPREWRWSSFHPFVALRHYEADWGRADLPAPEFGRVDESLIQ